MTDDKYCVALWVTDTCTREPIPSVSRLAATLVSIGPRVLAQGILSTLHAIQVAYVHGCKNTHTYNRLQGEHIHIQQATRRTHTHTTGYTENTRIQQATRRTHTHTTGYKENTHIYNRRI